MLWQALGFPEVEDPIPNRIGLGHIIAFTGAGAVLGEVFRFGSSPTSRERAVRFGSLVGFGIGAAVYFLSLLAEIISAL
jgi:hypothetical protein